MSPNDWTMHPFWKNKDIFAFTVDHIKSTKSGPGERMQKICMKFMLRTEATRTTTYCHQVVTNMFD